MNLANNYYFLLILNITLNSSALKISLNQIILICCIDFIIYYSFCKFSIYFNEGINQQYSYIKQSIWDVAKINLALSTIVLIYKFCYNK